jgi:hypothetical protein
VRVRPSPSGFALLNLYPNPAVRELVIEWNARRQGQANIIITDVQGKIVYNKALPTGAGYNQTRLPVDYLASGTYYLRISVDKEVITQKFMRK